MKRLLHKSLLLRLGLALSTITTLAFIGMLSSVYIAEMGKGDASAINQAGSLRMQSYRIAATLLHYQNASGQSFDDVQQAAAEFVERLSSNRLTDALPGDHSHPISDTYELIKHRWRAQILPLLDEGRAVVAAHRSGRITAHTLSDFQTRYLSRVTDFVDEIDRFVNLLESAAEAKIERLRIIQVISLFLTLAVVFITLHLMHTDVLIPLRDLLTCAEKARHGDFSARVAHTRDDELGRLGHAFNVMSEDLSRKYADLEARVREKTTNLKQSNRSLELLYKATVLLNSGPLTESTYRLLLADISNLAGTGPGTICLAKHNDTRAIKLASTRDPEPGRPDLCLPPNCQECFENGETHVIEIARGDDMLRVLSVPIRDQAQTHGVLLVEIPPGVELEDWQRRLLDTVAKNIANAIAIAQRNTEARRLALLEERGVIARELHDSLAQSLSYLKIQVSRIAAALQQPEGVPAATAVIDELREGLNSAYRQLRELLTTFRLRMDGHGLSEALEATVREFSVRNDIRIDLRDRLYSEQLTPNEEIHILQLVREAIANVAKHAQARECQVVLESLEDGRVAVTIEDDGVGMPPEPKRMQHYGLAIMEERAQILGGKMIISHREPTGTRVRLTFVPTSRTNTENKVGLHQ